MEDKFKNIKEGDVLYIHKGVRYAWSSREYFFVPFKVAKTTPKQFFGDNGMRFSKKDGSAIGDSGRCFYKGDNYYGYSTSEKVSDETKKMQDFIKKINLEKRINDIAESIKIILNSELQLEELYEISKQLEIISEKIKK